MYECGSRLDIVHYAQARTWWGGLRYAQAWFVVCYIVHSRKRGGFTLREHVRGGCFIMQEEHACVFVRILQYMGMAAWLWGGVVSTMHEHFVRGIWACDLLWVGLRYA